LRLTFAASSAGLFDWDVVEDRVEYSSALAVSLVGKSPQPATFAEFEARIHPDDLGAFRALLALHIEQREALRPSELRLLTEGEYHWYELSAQAVWSDNGAAKRVVGSVTNITERKLQEQRIARLTRIHAVLSGINSTILRISERSALLRESCRIAVRVGELSFAVVAEPTGLGVSPVVASDGATNLVDRIGTWLIDAAAESESLVFDAIRTRRPAFVNDLKQDDARVELRQELLEAGHRAIAVVPVRVSERIDATFALVADTPGFFDDDQVKLLAELADNIGFALEHKAQAERLDFLAYHDELTQLANRRLFTDRLETQLRVSESDRKLAVIMIDIERFRHVNETLGRSAGDQLLLELAGRLKVRSEGKGTLARFASNTFAVALGQVEDEAAVAQWVEEALHALVQPITVAATELRLAAKVGISLFPSDGGSVDALLANCEAALKKAKASPHPYLFYTASMNGRVAERLTLETKLRRALEQREFLLHYQPKVDFKTGRVVGLEALVRWSPPEGGLVSPGLFVPVLEETGLIVRVGEWILERAAAQFTDWSERGLAPPRIAVNVSPHQLGQQDFVRVVERIAEKYPLTVSGLDLEITESVLMEDFQVNTEKLRAARNLGLSVAIDDFGTGYSSLGYLRRLPIDALKIDRSFVIRMHEDPQEMSIVTTIISLAHSLDLKVIAEGVETLQQAQLLRLLKCDQAQGYFLAKPQAAADVEPLLSRVFDLSGRAP
jgi:diguanylate cyclase (GGDEF)-like protein/PAS domain S-box-containing protein